MKSVFFALLMLSGLNAFSEVQILTVTGASAVKTNVPGVTTIFGGMSGDTCNHSPCNSCEQVTCATAPFCACNTNRITDDQVVTIQVKSKSHVRGHWTLTNGYGIPQFNLGAYVPGQTQVLQLSWAQLCNGNSGMGMTCEGPTFDASLFIGIANGDQLLDSTTLEVITLNPAAEWIDDCSGTSNAICGFRVTPAKGGAALSDVRADQAFPAWIKSVRVYGSTIDFAHASPTSASVIQDFAVNSEGSIQIPTIPLKDNKTTYFRVATVDIAGNISNFISDANIQSAGQCSYPIDSDPNDECRYRYTPQSRK